MFDWVLNIPMRPLEHVYMRPEMISKRFGNLHGDFTAAAFQTAAKLYCTGANDIF